MAIVDLTMAKMGERIMEATILRWHKHPGDRVSPDETVLEIATDKVDSEVPSIVEGEITELLFEENAVVPVGAVIARINTADESAPAADTEAASPAIEMEAEEIGQEEMGREEESAAPGHEGTGRFY